MEAIVKCECDQLAGKVAVVANPNLKTGPVYSDVTGRNLSQGANG
jgi:hypothetical protein